MKAISQVHRPWLHGRLPRGGGAGRGRDTQVPARLGEGGSQLHRPLRGERLADRADQHLAREESADGEGDARRSHRRRGDAVEPGRRRVRLALATRGNFPASGHWTPVPGSSPPSPGVYAVSIPGVHPSACITWFQATQACRLAGKRLLTNGEWQDAAAGTPDPGTDNGTTDCNISTAGDVVEHGLAVELQVELGRVRHGGERGRVGGGLGGSERPPAVQTGRRRSGFPATTAVCFGGGSVAPTVPGALIRGRGFDNGAIAGVFAMGAGDGPAGSFSDVGFRCAR